LLKRHTTTVKSELVIDFLNIVYDPYAGQLLTEPDEMIKYGEALDDH
jgi:hypothetical protein